jgi:Icc-related predicted phosphoesterase
VFFSADVHGSEKAFMKFLNAGKFYKVDNLILGGDLTGKMIVTVVEHGSGTYKAHFLGSEVVATNENELMELEKNIRYTGYYPYRTDPAGKEALDSDPSKLNALFSQLMNQSVARWIKIAEERLKGIGIPCYMMPGNDDRLDLDKVFEESNYVMNPEGKVVDLDENHEMISTGYTNITPWRAPRDISEEELSKRIESMVSEVRKMDNCVFQFHCPPYDTNLDTAPKLDEQLRPSTSETISAGSKAVRESIEKYQPLLGLHGHIHESKGVDRIGRTLCINPGSEYTEGILRGALLSIQDGKVKNYLLTTG